MYTPDALIWDRPFEVAHLHLCSKALTPLSRLLAMLSTTQFFAPVKYERILNCYVLYILICIHNCIQSCWLDKRLTISLYEQQYL